MAASSSGRSPTGRRGVVPVGTTGESPTLSHAEHQRAIEIAVESAAGRVPVIAGDGVEQHGGGGVARVACQTARGECGDGGDAVLQQADAGGGCTCIIKAIADAVDLPIDDLQHPATQCGGYERRRRWRGWRRHPQYCGRERCHDANLARPLHTTAGLRAGIHPACPARIIQRAAVSWRPAGMAASRVSGQCGAARCAPICTTAWAEGRVKPRRWRYRTRLLGLHDAMFCESNPVPGEVCREPAGA